MLLLDTLILARIRRIKCDEGKPACLRCSSTGRKCDGYETGLSRLTEAPSNKDRLPSCSDDIARGLSLQIPGNDLERRTFRFFRDRTAVQLSTNFSQPDFWHRLVPQATHHEPSIRYAVLAIASIHEELVMGHGLNVPADTDQAIAGFGTRQYTKAIRGLNSCMIKDGQLAADVVLTCCALFACFENLRGHYGPAIAHVDGGLKILASLQNTHGPASTAGGPLKRLPTPYICFDDLDIIFTQLDNRATEVAGSRLVHTNRAATNPGQASRAKIPNTFYSIQECRDSLEYHKQAFVQSMPMCSDDLSGATIADIKQTQAAYLETLRKWSNALNSFLERSESSLSTQDLLASLMLKVQERVANITCSKHFDSTNLNETKWDHHIEAFADLVMLGTTVVDALHKEEITMPRDGPIPSMHEGISGPMFLVASRCRDPVVRRQAISVIKRSPRQEGMWDQTLMVRIAERIMAMEEEGLAQPTCAGDIPHSARIFDITPRFDPNGRRGHVELRSPRGLWKEYLEW
ncbi:MAG: hypothetical protein M1817_005799 [Caeruleum heppii]|nr:MAG: hypothetical protein M1817_005799 [Caeruleum heppii]